MNNKNKTVVKCFLTGCKYNSACCTDPYDYNNREFYCMKSNITIDLNEEDLSSGFECQDFVSGRKPYKCKNCIKQAGEDVLVEDDDIFTEVSFLEAEDDEEDDDVLC